MFKIAMHLFLLFQTFITSQAHAETLVKRFSLAFPHLIEMNCENSSMIAANGISQFRPSALLFPKNEGDLLSIMDFHRQLRKNYPELRPLIVSAGGRNTKGQLSQGWSFDGQAHGEDGSIVINTKYLSGIRLPIDWHKDYNPMTQELLVWMYAGTTWGETIRLVNESYQNFSSDHDNYFVPIIAPTGSDISLGGSFASNTHARASSVVGGYFSDNIDAFTVATTRNGITALLTITKKDEKDLFNAMVGSFGRGGVVTSMRIKLLRISKEKQVITRMRRVVGIEELTKELLETRNSLRKRAIHDVENKAFLATGAIVNANFDEFLIFENEFAEVTTKKPEFPLFKTPTCETDILYGVARACPKLSEVFMRLFFNWHASENLCDFLFNTSDKEEVAEFHNRPLDNYIFFQDGFASQLSKKVVNGYETGHLSFVMELDHLPLAIRIIKHVKQQKVYNSIQFELQDLLPVSKTDVLMSPSYTDNNNNSPLLVYTLSWPINHKNKDASLQFKKELERKLIETQLNGHPLAWLHPLKEFSHLDSHKYFSDRAEKLEEVFKNYGINDRGLFTNKVQASLYETKDY